MFCLHRTAVSCVLIYRPVVCGRKNNEQENASYTHAAKQNRHSAIRDELPKCAGQKLEGHPAHGEQYIEEGIDSGPHLFRQIGLHGALPDGSAADAQTAAVYRKRRQLFEFLGGSLHDKLHIALGTIVIFPGFAFHTDPLFLCELVHC